MPSSFTDWYAGLPKINRALLTSWVFFAVGAKFFSFIVGLILYYVVLNPGGRPFSLAIGKLQLWRLVTNFFYGGQFGMNPFAFIFKCLFLYRHSFPLERDTYQGRGAQYLTMMLFCATVSLLFLVPFPWLAYASYGSDAILSSSLYLWARNNPETIVSIYGIFQVEAFYLPFVMLGLNAVLSAGIPYADAVGIVAGHLFWFLDVLHPAATGRPSFIPVFKVIRALAEMLGTEAPVVTRPSNYMAFRGSGRRLND